MKVGGPMGLYPGHTSSIRRIEAAMLSYHADMTLDNNPYELGMDRLVDLEMKTDFISKNALMHIKAEGVSQLQVGLEFEGNPLVGSNDELWPITIDGAIIGKVTSAIYSPRLKKNIALALVAFCCSGIGTNAVIEMPSGHQKCTIVPKPFYDPKKLISTQA